MKLKALGLCKKCYGVHRKKEKLKLELSKLTNDEILNIKRPQLPIEFWDNNDVEIISNALFDKMEYPLYYL